MSKRTKRQAQPRERLWCYLCLVSLEFEEYKAHDSSGGHQQRVQDKDLQVAVDKVYPAIPANLHEGAGPCPGLVLRLGDPRRGLYVR